MSSIDINQITTQNTNFFYSSFGDLRKIIPKIVKEGFPILLRGSHGIGKSEFVKSLVPILTKTLELESEMGFIDRRLSQCADAGDIIGIPIPDNEKKVTNHLPMSWFRRACDEPVILFADEIDRAQMDVRQALFELGDSRKIHGHSLHPKTVVFAACNGTEHNDGTYQVTNFDPAELNRWWTADVSPSFSDWASWAEENKVHPQIIEFCRENQNIWNWKGELAPNRIYPTPRSWARFSRTLTSDDIKQKDVKIFLNLCSGFVGKEASIKLWDFIQNYDKIISVEDIIDNGLIYAAKRLNNIELIDLGNRIMTREDLRANILPDHKFSNFVEFLKILPAENFAKMLNDFCLATGETGLRRLKPLLPPGLLVKIYTGDFKLQNT